MNTHYKLANGDIISKCRVDDAIELLNRLRDGFTVVELTDEELFCKGNKFDAIKRFHEKYNVGLMEAKCAIEFLRGEEVL